MNITLANGNTLAVEPDGDSARYAELTGDDWVELRFSMPEYVEIEPGSAITFNGNTYHVERPQDVTIIHRMYYEYVVRFDSASIRLHHLMYSNPDDGRVEFSVTGPASTHLALLVRGANVYGSLTWTQGACIADNESLEKTISYDTLTLWDALELMGETFGCEWECIGTDIRFLRQVEYNKSLPLSLQYGEGNGLRTGIRRTNLGDKPPVKALVVKGSSTNINTSSDLTSYGSKTLHMAIGNSGVPLYVGYDGEHYIYQEADGQGDPVWSTDPQFNALLAKYFLVNDDGRMLLYCGNDITDLNTPSMGWGDGAEVADLSAIYPQKTHTVTAVSTEQVHFADDPTETYLQYTITISINNQSFDPNS